VLVRPHWTERLTDRDCHAPTLLFSEHVNPYGRQELDTHPHCRPCLTEVAAGVTTVGNGPTSRDRVAELGKLSLLIRSGRHPEADDTPQQKVWAGHWELNHGS
jgi:hypothetical protein